MENYNDDSFEGFLRKEVENQNIYPSEHVWENIRVKLHGNPAWPALTFGVMLILATVIVFTALNYPSKSILIKSTGKSIIQSDIQAGASKMKAGDSGKNTSYSDFYKHLNPTAYFSVTPDKNYLVDDSWALNEVVINKEREIDNISTIKLNRQTVVPPINSIKQMIDVNIKAPVVAVQKQNKKSKSESITATENKSKYANKLNFPLNTSLESNPSADGYLNDFAHKSIPHSKLKSKLELQFYVTPSVSYRNLSEDKSRVYYQTYTTYSTFSQSLHTNVNSVVRQAPALGFEVGGSLLYKLTPALKIKTGLQFNIRQYYIDAYQSFGIATITVVKDYRLDSVQYFSMLSNTNNGNSTKVNNKLYQISVPIGLQLDFFNKKKFGLSIGASLQPTFTLNKNVYVISTDYKYYTNGAPFFRKWNLNSSADINFTYKAKNIKWYIGPQIRYQHYPTYNDVYPIKEYRLDYGIKVGFTTPLFK